VIFQDFTAASIKMSAICDIEPFSLVKVDVSEGSDPNDGGSTDL
jgi:hypothetical protein